MGRPTRRFVATFLRTGISWRNNHLSTKPDKTHHFRMDSLTRTGRSRQREKTGGAASLISYSVWHLGCGAAPDNRQLEIPRFPESVS